MTLDLTPDELLTTTRAVRARLDFDKPFEQGHPLEWLVEPRAFPQSWRQQ